MIRFQFAPLNDTLSIKESLAILEIGAYFAQRMTIDDLEIDKDLAIATYIRKSVPVDMRENMAAEPEQTETEMMEVFASEVMDLARKRLDLLGENYPFDIDGNFSISLKSAPISSVGVGYLVVQAMRLAQSNLVEIDLPSGQERRNAEVLAWRIFERVFEYIAAYALAGDRGGLPLMLSNCRSSRILHRKLSAVCRRVGAGVVKTYDQWSPSERSSNDGGVDVLLHVGGPGMPGNAYVILAGATYQKANIGGKIISFTERNRFRGFFATTPSAFVGALVRLGEVDELTLDKCRNADCQLYGYNEIIEFMGKRDAGHTNLKALWAIDSRLRQVFSLISGISWSSRHGELKRETL